MSALPKDKMKQFCLLICVLGCFFCHAADSPVSDASLAKSIRGLYRSVPEDAPCRYAVDMIASRFWHTSELAILEGHLKVSKQEHAAARKRLLQLQEEIRSGKQWETPVLQLTIPYMDTPPVIDGKITRNEWSNAYTLYGEYTLNETKKSGGKTRWYIGYDKQNVYIACFIPEETLTCYTYSRSAKEKQPWNGDCVEFFILPDFRLKCYREVVINPAGQIFTALHTKSRGETRLSENRESKHSISAAARKTATGYSVEAAIPFRDLPGYFLGNSPNQGETLQIAFLRTHAGKFFSAWPMLYGGHNIYGYMQGKLEKTKKIWSK